MVHDREVDLLVVGGGINGVGIARDAAGRGLSVMLCEQGDLGGATSSASSKLIHGGLRYLENYAFRFVRESLIEREVLLAAAPHLITPVRFVLPLDESLRPAWLIGLGLFLYDRLGRRQRLPGSQRLDLRESLEGAPLDRRFTSAFAYSDCVVDDSRLVLLNAVDARERGALIRTRSRCSSLVREGGLWRVKIADLRGRGELRVAARSLVNAAGPWADEVQRMAGLGERGRKLRLVKGSHIVLPRLYRGSHAYILQNDDGRVVFVIPYAGDFSLVGTTESPFSGDPAKAEISPDERAYLCRAVSRYFAKPLLPASIVHAFSGVRPLYDDKAKSVSRVSRDYVLDLDRPAGEAPLLSVLGGKITTYRRLAEEALERLSPFSRPPCDGAWTAGVPLPGGDFEPGDFGGFRDRLRAEYPWLTDSMATRLAHAYGTRATRVLGKARGLDDLGMDFGNGLTRTEVDYMIAEEWAETGEDVLWRRSKLGLAFSEVGRARLADYVARQVELRGEEPRHG